MDNGEGDGDGDGDGDGVAGRAAGCVSFESCVAANTAMPAIATPAIPTAASQPRRRGACGGVDAPVALDSVVGAVAIGIAGDEPSVGAVPAVPPTPAAASSRCSAAMVCGRSAGAFASRRAINASTLGGTSGASERAVGAGAS